MSRLFSLPERPPLRFAMGGDVTDWDPNARRLQLGPTEMWVASSVAVPEITPGAAVTVMGHVEGAVPRRVVTVLTVQRRADRHDMGGAAMYTQTCQGCGEEILPDAPGPVVTDKNGFAYHFACWGKAVVTKASLKALENRRPPPGDPA